MAIAISLISSFMFISDNLLQQNTEDNMDAIYANQIELFMDSDQNPTSQNTEKLIPSKLSKLGTHLKSHTINNIVQDGRSLQIFNHDLKMKATDKYLYDSQELLNSDDDDYPWGHIYTSRVFCSVLTMWPERRQNIEVMRVICVSLNAYAVILQLSYVCSTGSGKYMG